MKARLKQTSELSSDAGTPSVALVARFHSGGGLRAVRRAWQTETTQPRDAAAGAARIGARVVPTNRTVKE
jgi:hypothetical protein